MSEVHETSQNHFLHPNAGGVTVLGVRVLDSKTAFDLIGSSAILLVVDLGRRIWRIPNSPHKPSSRVLGPNSTRASRRIRRARLQPDDFFVQQAQAGAAFQGDPMQEVVHMFLGGIKPTSPASTADKCEVWAKWRVCGAAAGATSAAQLGAGCETWRETFWSTIGLEHVLQTSTFY